MIKYDVKNNGRRNTVFGLLLKIINIVGAFLARTILIYKLGIEYVGLDGLLTSVLTMLNMAELGFSSAVVYKLYKPIAEQKTSEICALLYFYRKIYRYIGLFVISIGVCLIPFLHHCVDISRIPEGVNLYLLYIIYLCNTSFGYLLFAHKTALLNAHQRNDLVSKITSAVFCAKFAFQILILLLFSNYYLYVIVIPLSTLFTNVGCAFLAKKYYPQYECKGDIGSEDKREITKKIKALMYNKIGVALINGSDNVVISRYLGLVFLGTYDSYYYIFSMLYSIFEIFYTSIVAGIGNRIVTVTIDDNYRLFQKLFFINFWAVSWASICLMCLYPDFMTLWIGNNNIFHNSFSILMGIYFFVYLNRFIVLTYKNAQGLWWEDRFRPFCEAILNVTLNIILVKFISIYGVTLSTVIAMIVISLPWESKVLYNNYFKRSLGEFVRMYLHLLVPIIPIACLCIGISYVLPGGICGLIIKSMVCIIVPNMLLYLVFRNNENIQFLKSLIKK